MGTDRPSGGVRQGRWPALLMGPFGVQRAESLLLGGIKVQMVVRVASPGGVHRSEVTCQQGSGGETVNDNLLRLASTLFAQKEESKLERVRVPSSWSFPSAVGWHFMSLQCQKVKDYRSGSYTAVSSNCRRAGGVGRGWGDPVEGSSGG